MIGKIRNVQDSWIMKSILILTALSFMSLFGISGYVNSSGGNKPVIKVDDLVLTQSQISGMFNQELQTAQHMFGNNLEINESIRNALLQGIVQRELSNAILEKTASDNNVYVSDELIKKIIASQQEFMDENGKFSPIKMRRLLSAAGLNEQKYIENLRKDIIKMHLVYNVVEGVNVPGFMADYLYKTDNQKKVFKFINVEADEMKIDRQISPEEIEQYYNDFATQFIEPENRDISFISLSGNEIAGKAKVSEEDVIQYYNENKDQFTIPETRNILQMVFVNEADAQKAYEKVKNGADFYTIAKEDAKQEKASTDLGIVQKDMLIGEMGEIMFDLKKGEISEPMKSEFGWHVMKVTEIKPMNKTSLESAKTKIAETLRKEGADEAESDLIAKIEDAIGTGKDLKTIAAELNVPVYTAKGISEDGKVKVAPQGFDGIVKSEDFVETAFSYNVGELSQVFETESGLAVISVDKVIEPRQKSIEEVTPEIKKMWQTSEKTAIVQEVINDVIHDVENGDNIDSVANRFGLKVNTTSPLTKNETFGGLSVMEVQDLFRENLNSPKVIGETGQQTIVVPIKIINTTASLSRGDIQNVRKEAEKELAQEMAQQLITDYGTNYKVRVKYKALGFIE